jgi:integrase
MENIIVVNNGLATSNQTSTDVFAKEYYEESIIIRYLNRDIADKTRDSDERVIKDFFGVDRVDDITVYDVVKVSPRDAENYKKKLVKSGLKIGTVKTRITQMHGLFQYICDKCVDNTLGIKLLVSNPFNSLHVKMNGKSVVNKSRSYGSFTREEVCKLMQVTRKPFDLLYEMAVMCGVRKEALLNLKLEDITKKKGRYVINIDWDKTKGNIQETITNEMYEKACKYSKDNDGNIIFGYTGRTVDRQLERDCNAIGISKDEMELRYLTFHSFKKTCGELAMLYSGNDLNRTKEKLKHSSISTTADIYLNKKDENPNDDIGLKFKLKNVDCNKELKEELYKLDRTELVDLIMDEFDDDIKILLLDKLIAKNSKVDVNKIV